MDVKSSGVGVAIPAPKSRLSLWKRNPSLVIGGLIAMVLLLIALFPGAFTDMSPYDVDAKHVLVHPSAAHWFGTDNFGRDVFSRVIHSTRLDLLIGVLAMIVPFLMGSALGLIAGYYGGKLDVFIMRVVDIVMAFPYMLLAIAIVAVLGAGVKNMILSMWLLSWKGYCRLIRSEVMTAKNREYVQAAKALGYSNARIMLRHILPNVISNSIVLGASDIVMCMLAGAAMSYLGLGVQAPTPEWGAIISGGRPFIMNAWWITLFPGLFLILAGLAFSLIGDGLSDLLRTKGK